MAAHFGFEIWRAARWARQRRPAAPLRPEDNSKKWTAPKASQECLTQTELCRSPFKKLPEETETTGIMYLLGKRPSRSIINSTKVNILNERRVDAIVIAGSK